MRRFLLLFIFLAGCAVNPVTGNPDFVLVSSEKEKQLGATAAAEIEQTTGFYDGNGIEAYVRELGQRLAVHSPRKDVDYTFHVLDLAEPNAFALPGGYVYVTRGLLVLANSEDELAGVIGHEIGHIAARHAVRQISRNAPLGILTGITAGVTGMVSPALGSLVGGVGGLASGLVMAPYSRDQEREADRIGQQIAADAGYDPAAMSAFLDVLQRDEKLRGGGSQGFSFLATHPATPERVENTATFAKQIKRADEAPLSPTRTDFLDHLKGLPTGVNVASGYFLGRTFIQPDFDILIMFPDGWQTENTPQAAMASSPDGGAGLSLALAAKSDDPMEGARQLAAKAGKGLLDSTETTKIGDLPAARAQARTRGPRGDIGIDITWIAYKGNVFQITGVTSLTQFTAFGRPFEQTRESFRGLRPDERAAVRENRLQLTEGKAGETPEAIASRTNTTWSAAMLAVANGLPANAPLDAARTLKVSLSEKYP